MLLQSTCLLVTFRLPSMTVALQWKSHVIWRLELTLRSSAHESLVVPVLISSRLAADFSFAIRWFSRKWRSNPNAVTGVFWERRSNSRAAPMCALSHTVQRHPLQTFVISWATTSNDAVRRCKCLHARWPPSCWIVSWNPIGDSNESKVAAR